MKKFLIAAGLIALSAGVASAQQSPTANSDHKDGAHAQHGAKATPAPTPAPTPSPTPAPTPSPTPTSPAPTGPTE